MHKDAVHCVTARAICYTHRLTIGRVLVIPHSLDYDSVFATLSKALFEPNNFFLPLSNFITGIYQSHFRVS